MPYGIAPIDINLDGDNRGNHYAPLLVSSKGRYVWCEKAFRFALKDKTLRVTSAGNMFRHDQAGQNLRDAYRHAAKSFFPTDGKLPDRALFAMPQYNTWIELMYDQNQRWQHLAERLRLPRAQRCAKLRLHLHMILVKSKQRVADHGEVFTPRVDGRGREQ